MSLHLLVSEDGLEVHTSPLISGPQTIVLHSRTRCPILSSNTTWTVLALSEHLHLSESEPTNPIVLNSWEYPGVQAAGQNVVSPMDTSNFLAFLQEFRNTPVGKKLILAASVPVSPFRDAQGNTSKDLSGFAKVLNYITIMDYDIFGSWSSAVGPNAPLADSCAPTQYQQGSATSAVNKWMSTGFPANQIVLGVPSYGHSYRVKSSDAFVNNPTSKLGLSSNELAAYPPFDQNDQPEGDAWGGSAGTFEFWGLIKGGFLDEQGAPAQGIYSRFDSCSQTVRISFVILGKT